MTKEQILIAEFMGASFKAYKENHSFDKRFKTYAECQKFIEENYLDDYAPEIGWPLSLYGNYYKDWNSLMPACKKFDSFVLDDFKTFPQWTNYVMLCDNIDDAVTTYDIEKAFAALVKAITWYKHFGQ